MKANVSKYMASEAAAYAATFNPMGQLDRNPRLDRSRRQPDRFSTPTGTSSTTKSPPAARTSARRRARADSRPGSEARLQLGVLGLGAARADAEGLDYRRLLSPEVRQPPRQRQPEPEPDATGTRSRSSDRRIARFPDGGGENDHDVQPEPEQGGHGQPTLSSRSRRTTTTSTTASSSAATPGSARGSSSPASRPSGANARLRRQYQRPGDSARQPQRLALLRQRPSVPTTFKGSASYTMPWDIQVSGSFIARPGHQRCRQLHGDLRHRRPADRRSGPRARRRSPSTWSSRIRCSSTTRSRSTPASARPSVRPLPGAGLRRYLQRAERRYGHDRQRDVRRQPRDAHLDEPDGDPHRPHGPVRHAVGVLRIG